MEEMTQERFQELAGQQVIVRALLRESDRELNAGTVQICLWAFDRRFSEQILRVGYVCSFAEPGINLQFECGQELPFELYRTLDFSQWGAPELRSDKPVVVIRRSRNRLVEQIEPHTFSLVLHLVRLQTLLSERARGDKKFGILSDRFNIFLARQLNIWYNLVR